MSNQALVSVIIPAYKAAFFEQALQSAICQDYSNLEIVICDDSGSDVIRQIVNKVQSETPREIRYFFNETRLMEIGNVDRCLKASRGEYIKFLYDDDVLQNTCVSKLVAALEADTGNILASSRRQRIDEMGNLLPDTMATSYPFRGDVILAGKDLIAFLSDYIINFIGEPSSVLCRRKDLIAFGDELFLLNGQRMRYLGDMAIYIKLLSQGNLAFLSESLSFFRVSTLQVSHQAAADKEVVATTYTQFPRMIRQLGWYQGDKIANQQVRVTALGYPNDYIKYNLLDALSSALHLSGGSRANKNLDDWLAGRKTTAIQQRYIDDYVALRDRQPTLGIYILSRGQDEDKLQQSLDSVMASMMAGIALTPVIISTKRVHGDEHRVQWLQADAGEHVTAINHHLATVPFDWAMIIRAGSIVTYCGVLQLAVNLPGATDCTALYCDELYQQDGEITGTSFRPDFNLDLLLSHPGEMAKHWLFKRATLLSLGGFTAGYRTAWEFDFIIKIIENCGTNAIGHLPEPLVISPSFKLVSDPETVEILQQHLQHRGYPDADVEIPHPGLYALKYHHATQPLVSIIIPTKDQLPMLITCIMSLLEKTHYKNYELLIVDNNSETPEAQQWLAGLATIDPDRIKVLRFPYPFNYSAMNNLAAREARGEYLVLLNNDTAIINEFWLDNLLNHAQRPEVGIVGAKLLYPDGRIQHAGVLLGLRGPAEHPFIEELSHVPGYMCRLLVDQNYSAVTAACLMIRASTYHAVGGLDEDEFKVSYNDVDLCLKVREAGFMTVWTPHAVVMHEGSVSQNNVDKATQEKKYQRFVGEQDAFYKKWLPVISHDPAYNINLSLDGNGFKLEQMTEITWRPLAWKPVPVVMALMADFTGCGQYRIIKPHQAMVDEGIIEGRLVDMMLNTAQLARYAPDSIVLQRQISAESHEWLSRLRVLSATFKVFELDDYLPNLPLKNAHRVDMPKDILKSIRKSLSMVDRFVVSTPALAERFAGTHPDIQIAENRLPLAEWGNLTSLRGQGDKPRIGWAGGASHTGDLEMIYDVVRALADRVEWVFLGMCPPKLLPFIHEYHDGVEISAYPAKLASLNLDLALAPVEDNEFNRCKSNLRLLEYGACGFPVVCSDIECYRDAMPVTRVRNRFKDWMEAIEMHLDDRETSWRTGDALREVVLSQWMLTGEPLERWAKLWLPGS